MGKPLLVWTVEAAKAARSVDRVVVSTDDAEIADVACRSGAEVVWRPAELSDDMASSEAALLHVLESLEINEGMFPELLVFLQCTSPLTIPEDIDGTVRTLIDEGADSALAVAPFHYFLWGRDGAGNAVGINHVKSIRPMRQEREPQFIETGAVYAMRAEGFRKAGNRFFGKTAMYVIPPERRWEIDDPVDLQVAETLLRHHWRFRSSELLPEHIAGIALDFDGVFTDNKVAVFEDGREAVICSRSDGWGLSELKGLGVPIVVISMEQNPVVAARCRKLGIECLQAVKDKLACLEAWAARTGTDFAGLIFVGNDVNDRACLESVGCPVVVADAFAGVKPLAKIILSSRGGEGALRELAELVKQRRGGRCNV